MKSKDKLQRVQDLILSCVATRRMENSHGQKYSPVAFQNCIDLVKYLMNSSIWRRVYGDSEPHVRMWIQGGSEPHVQSLFRLCRCILSGLSKFYSGGNFTLPFLKCGRLGLRLGVFCLWWPVVSRGWCRRVRQWLGGFFMPWLWHQLMKSGDCDPLGSAS